MRWLELEQLADIAQPFEPALLSGSERLPVDPEQELEWMDHTIKSLRLDSLLSGVRERWNTGTILPFESPWDYTNNLPARGVVLVSDPYPVIQLSGSGHQLSAALKHEQTELRLFLTGRNAEHDRAVHVVDKNTYDLSTHNPSFSGSFKWNMDLYGIAEGVRRTATPKGALIQPTVFKAPDQSSIACALSDHTHSRQELECMPEEMYAWADEVTSQIPELLQKGSLNAKELRNWAYDVQKTPRLFRWIDKGLPQLFQLALY